jgi:RNA 3'-terminal phosphate cyclase (ATP)
VRAETLGREAGAELALEIASGAMLDEHAADQVLVFLAMAARPSSFTVRQVSSHASTAMWLLGHFLPVKFEVVPEGALSRVLIRPGRDSPRA